MPQPAKEGEKRRTRATEAEVMAAQLNHARELLMAKQQEILALSKRCAEAEHRSIALEMRIGAIENEKFREEHGLVVGRSLQKDEKGEWWWEDEAPLATKPDEEAAPVVEESDVVIKDQVPETMTDVAEEESPEALVESQDTSEAIDAD